MKVGPNTMSNVFIRKRKFGHREDGGRDWSDVSTNQGAPRTADHAQKLEEAGKDPLGETCGAET